MGKGAVVSDHEVTSRVGKDILKKGGSAVDAAVAMAICNGVMTMHSMGIGGDALLVIKPKDSTKTVYIDGIGEAPEKINIEMNEPGCTVAVPGALRAYKLAHQKYGLLQWDKLFEPTLEILREGVPMAQSTHNAYHLSDKYPEDCAEDYIDSKAFPELCSMFYENGQALKAGDKLRWPGMVETLEAVAKEGPDFLYNNKEVTPKLVRELQEKGGMHTTKDFQQYKARSGPAYTMSLGDFTLHTVNGACGGPVVALALKILKGFDISPHDVDTLDRKTEVFHRIMEATKLVMSVKDELGDIERDKSRDMANKIIERTLSDEYAESLRQKIGARVVEACENTQEKNEDTGTSHISVLGPEGDAVAVTSTICNYFGSKLVSPSTGIIWNDRVAFFARTQSEQVPECGAVAGNRCFTCMAPFIITDGQGNVRLIAGAAGSYMIIPVLIQVVVKLLWLKQSLHSVLEEKRMFYNTNTDGVWSIEEGFDEILKQKLMEKGHKFETEKPFKLTVVEAIAAIENEQPTTYADSRKPGGGALVIDI